MPDFVGRKWFLAPGAPAQTYRAEAATTRGGAVSLMFHVDGTFEITAPGPADKPRTRAVGRGGATLGRWHSHPDDPRRVTVEIPGQRIEYRVVAVGEDEVRLEEVGPDAGSASPR